MNKEHYSILEVGGAMKEARVPDWTATLTADLQQGNLKTVVLFPPFRQGMTSVPISHWSELQASFRIRQRERVLENACTVNDFYSHEEALLREAVLAASLRDVARLPSEYRKHMSDVGLLREPMAEEDWVSVVQWLSGCWEKLSDLDGRTLLHPVVQAHQLNNYLARLKQDSFLRGNPDYSKHPGGRRPSPHWEAVDAEIIRVLAGRISPLLDGQIQELARCVNARVKARIGADKTHVPQIETIAQRIRNVLKKDPANIAA